MYSGLWSTLGLILVTAVGLSVMWVSMILLDKLWRYVRLWQRLQRLRKPTKSLDLYNLKFKDAIMTKNYKLAQQANKDVVYGALQGLITNSKLWHSSPVGREYCHLTADGREVIVDLVQDLLRTIDVLERKALDERAKEITFETLKGTAE